MSSFGLKFAELAERFCRASSFGLKFAELTEGFLPGAAETLLIEAEVDEILRVIAEDFGGCQRGVDLGRVSFEVASVFVMRANRRTLRDDCPV